MTSAKFPALLKPLEIQRKALRSKAKKLEVQSSQKNDGKAGAEPAPASSLDFVTKVWPQLPLKFQQKITRSFVERYVISPGRVLIHHHFPLETDTTDQPIADPTNDPPEPIPGEPVYIRLPKAGTLCPLSGLTRAMLNELILPTPRNHGQPPVKSFSQCQDGKQRGVRMIVWASLRAYLLKQQRAGGGS